MKKLGWEDGGCNESEEREGTYWIHIAQGEGSASIISMGGEIEWKPP